MKLEEFQVYQLSMILAEDVWNIVIKWDYFAKDTVGKQLVRAVDSIAAILSEGFGRFHYNEEKHFSYYSRESLYESKTWMTKAFNRKLIQESDFVDIINRIDNIAMRLNAFINSIGKKYPE